MPVLRRSDAVVHRMHGGTFRSFVAPSRGSVELCAWQLTVPPDVEGVAHRPSREEVLLVLSGTVQLTLDGITTTLKTGDVGWVPAGTELRVDGGTDGAELWVTTTPGLEAITSDGTSIVPPWAR